MCIPILLCSFKARYILDPFSKKLTLILIRIDPAANNCFSKEQRDLSGSNQNKSNQQKKYRHHFGAAFNKFTGSSKE